MVVMENSASTWKNRVEIRVARNPAAEKCAASPRAAPPAGVLVAGPGEVLPVLDGLRQTKGRARGSGTGSRPRPHGCGWSRCVGSTFLGLSAPWASAHSALCMTRSQGVSSSGLSE